jgi:ABC-type nitrate/sulfonate/bicarbonate transport system substrate-binding protein
MERERQRAEGRRPTTARLRAAALALALAAAACARQEPRPRIAVAAVRQPATALFFVAQAAGCFEAERLDVDATAFELGRDALAQLQAGRAEAAVVFETPLLRAASADDRLRVLSTLHVSTRNTRLVARAASGIATFADLGGRRIGVARGTNADFFVDLVLRFGGVPRARATVLDLAPDESVRRLAAGDLDAAVLSDPPAAEAERVLGRGAAVLRTPLYAEVSLLVSRADAIEARRPALLALLRGLGCAERLARARPDDALARIRDRFPELTEAGLREQVARVEWQLGLDNVVAEILRRERDWLAAGANASGPALRRLVDPSLLEEVAPDAVMLLPGQGGVAW